MPLCQYCSYVASVQIPTKEKSLDPTSCNFFLYLLQKPILKTTGDVQNRYEAAASYLFWTLSVKTGTGFYRGYTKTHATSDIVCTWSRYFCATFARASQCQQKTKLSSPLFFRSCYPSIMTVSKRSVNGVNHAIHAITERPCCHHPVCFVVTCTRCSFSLYVVPIVVLCLF